ncbi:MAG: DUF560 domain-containing protein [Nitrosomonadales bacterium]|nr:DUF560 domain-containing protein [Nitrosomonadales bacterium]
MRLSSHRALVVLVCLLSLARPLAAQPFYVEPELSFDPFAAVRQLMLQKQWEAAEVEIKKIALEPGVDPIETLFLAGMIAAGSQNYPTAISLFQTVLNNRPELIRVRLELARAYLLSGNDEGAQYHFERVLAGDLPDAVIAKVQDYLVQIRSRRTWQAGFGIALLPDSNVNQATSAQTVSVAGLPFTLSSDARETSGVGVLWQLYGEKRWSLADRWRIAASAHLLRKDYSKNRFNDTTVTARLGPRYLYEQGEVGFGVSLSKRLLGDRSYNEAQGLFVDMNRQLGERWLLRAGLDVQWFDFAAGKGSPGTLTSTSAGLRYMLSPSSLLEGGLDFGQDTTISDQMQHQTLGASLAYRAEVAWGLLYGVNARIARSDYPVFQQFFNQYRHDAMSSFSMDATKRDWQLFGFSPVVSLTVIKNDSTIPLYSFQRALGQFGLNKQF